MQNSELYNLALTVTNFQSTDVCISTLQKIKEVQGTYVV